MFETKSLFKKFIAESFPFCTGLLYPLVCSVFAFEFVIVPSFQSDRLSLNPCGPSLPRKIVTFIFCIVSQCTGRALVSHK